MGRYNLPALLGYPRENRRFAQSAAMQRQGKRCPSSGSSPGKATSSTEPVVLLRRGEKSEIKPRARQDRRQPRAGPRRAGAGGTAGPACPGGGPTTGAPFQPGLRAAARPRRGRTEAPRGRRLPPSPPPTARTGTAGDPPRAPRCRRFLTGGAEPGVGEPPRLGGRRLFGGSRDKEPQTGAHAWPPLRSAPARGEPTSAPPSPPVPPAPG